MADINPTISFIMNKWVEALIAGGIGKACYVYPDHAIDELDLPYAVINEPSGLSPEGFTFSAQQFRVSGTVAYHVFLLPDNQARLYAPDAERILNAAMNLYLVTHSNKSLGRLANITLGEGVMKPLSPISDGESGAETAFYGGILIPYTLTIQRSS